MFLPFKEYSIFNSGSHFVRQNGTVLELGEIILNLGQHFRRCCLKILLILALVVIIFTCLSRGLVYFFL